MRELIIEGALYKCLQIGLDLNMFRQVYETTLERQP